MDNYMIFGRSVKASVVVPEAAHKDTFKNGNREWQFIPKAKIFREKKNSEAESRTDDQRAARVTGLLAKEKEKRQRLKELGISYDFPGYAALVIGKKK